MGNHFVIGKLRWGIEFPMYLRDRAQWQIEEFS